MKTDFIRSDSGTDNESGSPKFFTWAIIVVTAALLVATTSEFMPTSAARPGPAAQQSTTAVDTVTPDRT